MTNLSTAATRRSFACTIATRAAALLVVLGAAHPAAAQNATKPYARMAPIDQYLMADRNTEIALARSAAPQSIARDAEVLILGRHGFEPAIKGRNGFVCMVGRAWTATIDAEFWNPKVRVPMCLNAAAARTYLPRIVRITDMGLAGHSLAQVNDSIAAALARNELAPMESGAMCYMMSKQGYGGDGVPHWPSHLMFFYPQTDPATWGANLPGSPVLGIEDALEQMTSFAIPVSEWSDGTAALPATLPHVHK